MKESRRVLMESGMPKRTFLKRSLCCNYEQVFLTRMCKVPLAGGLGTGEGLTETPPMGHAVGEATRAQSSQCAE